MACLRRRAAEIHPLLQAGCQALDALGNQEDVVIDEAAQRNGVDGPVQLGQGVEHHALQARDAVPRPARHVLQQKSSCLTRATL